MRWAHPIPDRQQWFEVWGKGVGGREGFGRARNARPVAATAFAPLGLPRKGVAWAGHSLALSNAGSAGLPQDEKMACSIQHDLSGLKAKASSQAWPSALGRDPATTDTSARPLRRPMGPCPPPLPPHLPLHPFARGTNDPVYLPEGRARRPPVRRWVQGGGVGHLPESLARRANWRCRG